MTPTASPYFTSKFRAPRVPEPYVRRPRLVELLDDLSMLPVTLVVSPAGTGKTSMAADWLRQAGPRTAWLSLDEADQDVARLLTAIVSALEPWLPKQESAARPRPLPSTGLPMIQAWVAELERVDVAPVNLVIDDLHRIDADPSAEAAIALLVEHAPQWLHLLLLSRRAPSLPIERLAVAGTLAQIGFAELRFSEDEAVEMLTRLSPSVPAAELQAAATQARGWAAALRLSALASRVLRAQPDLVLGEDDAQLRLIDGYVWHEVFASEDPVLTDVLRDTATVDRISAPLAEALTGRPDAGERLAEAQRRGLFIHRLSVAHWFEVHGLVRDLLVNELARREPARLLEQHARAARWFEEAGESTAALDHWLASGRPREALRLLADSAAALLDSGRATTILRLTEQIPRSVATQDVESLTQYAWCHLLLDQDRFIEYVDQAVSLASRTEVEPRSRSRLKTLESISSVMTGDWALGKTLASQALVDLGDSHARDPIGRNGWNLVAHGLALSETWGDDTSEVREVRRAVARDPDRHLGFEGTRALGLALAGQPVDALRVAAGVRRTADVANLTILRAEVSISEALARRELGDRQDPDELPRLARTAAGPVSYSPVLAIMALIDQHLAQDDAAGARDQFDHLEHLVRSGFSGRGARSWLARMGTRVALAEGEPERARAWAERVEDPFWGPLSLARVGLATGARPCAARQLAVAMPRCPRHQVIQDLLRARAETARDAIGELVSVAVTRAAAHGLLQTVADEGSAVLELVERGAWSAPPQWLDRLRRLGLTDAGIPRGSSQLVEDLTQREREVLRLLPSRLTLPEIADELFVSPNTLKFHLRMIYRKLDVNSRSEAVAAARVLSASSSPVHGSSTLAR